MESVPKRASTVHRFPLPGQEERREPRGVTECILKILVVTQLYRTEENFQSSHSAIIFTSPQRVGPKIQALPTLLFSLPTCFHFEKPLLFSQRQNKKEDFLSLKTPTHPFPREKRSLPLVLGYHPRLRRGFDSWTPGGLHSQNPSKAPPTPDIICFYLVFFNS